MPCRVDIEEPSERSKHIRQSAKLLVYLRSKLFMEPEPWAVAQAEEYYAHDERCVTHLCAALTAMTPEVRDGIIYGNAKDPMARKLADWWEEHLRQDEARERHEMVEKIHAAEVQRRENLRASARAKLTQEEWDAIR